MFGTDSHTNLMQAEIYRSITAAGPFWSFTKFPLIPEKEVSEITRSLSPHPSEDSQDCQCCFFGLLGMQMKQQIARGRPMLATLEAFAEPNERYR